MAKTGKEIVCDWWGRPGMPETVGIVDLEKRIDAALQEARAEGEITGWENANKMVNATLGRNNQSTTQVCTCIGTSTSISGYCSQCGLPKATPTY